MIDHFIPHPPFYCQYPIVINSDFAIVLDKLKEAKKRVLVMSTRGHIARELLERAKFIDLRKLKDILRQ